MDIYPFSSVPNSNKIYVDDKYGLRSKFVSYYYIFSVIFYFVLLNFQCMQEHKNIIKSYSLLFLTILNK
jgi:hypothetical protein